MPTRPFDRGMELGDIPQSKEDKAFALADLKEGIRTGIYEEVSSVYAKDCMARGCMISSAFTTWNGEGDRRKGRFVVNFHRQSMHWPKGTVRMETLPSFALDLQRNDTLLSWDVKGGYRHMYLHPDIRDYFLFRYAGQYYRCIALPFGWGRSAMWFTKMMRVMVRHIRSVLCYRILPYIDDFLLAPSPSGRSATPADCVEARQKLCALFALLGIVRHPTKGCWEGSTVIDHLGMRIDTQCMKIYVTDAKVQRVRCLAKKVLLIAQRNQRLVPTSLLRIFCGVCVSLSLALPLARFYTRSIYCDIAAAERKGMGPSSGTVAGETADDLRRSGKQLMVPSRVRLSMQSLRDMRYWRALARGEGRDMHRVANDMCMHADAADIGYGGTLGHDMEPGSPGLWEGQGFWTAEDRAQSITVRELRAVRLLLHRHFSAYVSSPEVHKVLLQEDNQAVVSVLNSMVAASPPMMSELRKLRILLKVLGVRLEARWIPTAVNRFADRLSRTWDPGDIRATDAFTDSIRREHGLDEVAFRLRPLNEPYQARRRYLFEELHRPWSDGRARLWAPPFDILPLVIRKMQAERARGVLIAPNWPAQAWFARLVDWSSRMVYLGAREAHDALQQAETKLLNPGWGLVLAIRN